jgi:hypothetical protein
LDTNRTPGDFEVPKTIDHRDLKSATARSKLAIAKKPYWLSLAPGIALGYRRNGGRQSGETRSQAVGSWSVRYHGTNGAEWLKKIAIADDVESANPALGILDFTEAKAEALKLARTQPGVPEDTSRPLTVDEALDQYKQDLKARGASVYNESQLRGHVTASLLSKPVQLLAKSELTTWRNGLTAKMKPASVNRVCKSFRAALNLAANNDSRIANLDTWKLGLKGLPNAEEVRNVILTDEEVGSILLATYDRNDA